MTELFCRAGKRSFVADNSIGLVTWITRVSMELKQFSTTVFTYLSEAIEAQPKKGDLRYTVHLSGPKTFGLKN